MNWQTARRLPLYKFLLVLQQEASFPSFPQSLKKWEFVMFRTVPWNQCPVLLGKTRSICFDFNILSFPKAIFISPNHASSHAFISTFTQHKNVQWDWFKSLNGFFKWSTVTPKWTNQEMQHAQLWINKRQIIMHHSNYAHHAWMQGNEELICKHECKHKS